MILPTLRVSPPRSKNSLLKFQPNRNETRKKHPGLNSNIDRYFVISPFIPNKLTCCKSSKRASGSPIKVAEVYSKFKPRTLSPSERNEPKHFRSFSPKILNIVTPINLQVRLRGPRNLLSLSPSPVVSDNSPYNLNLPNQGLITGLAPAPLNHISNKQSTDSNMDYDLLNTYANY